MKPPRNRMQNDRSTRIATNAPAPDKPAAPAAPADPTPAAPSAPAESAPEPVRRMWQGPDVTYNPAHCPACGCSDNTIYKTYGKGERFPTIQNRLHECGNCGITFRSCHELSPTDIRLHAERAKANGKAIT